MTAGNLKRHEMCQIDVKPIQHQKPRLAVYCLVFDGPRLLVLKRTGTPYASGFWSVPAGHVDEGEPFLAAASSELEEETGLIVAQDAWSLVALMHRQIEDGAFIDVFLRTDVFSGALMNREPEKHGDLQFAGVAQLPSPIVPYVSQVLALLRRKGGNVNAAPLLLEYGWCQSSWDKGR